MKWFLDVLKGMVIGLANVIPGVSGGTMMVSMGIYDKVISSISHLFSRFRQSVKALWPLAVGMVLGIVGLSFLITFLFERFPLPTNTAFVGLILGGVPMLLPHLKNSGKKMNKPLGAVLFILAFALIIWMKIVQPGEGATDLALDVLMIVKLLLLGIVASATMIIPGVSGSMVMMLLGFYAAIIASVKGLVVSLTGGVWADLLHYVGILLPFGIGIVIGIFGVAKLLELLLKKQEGLTYCAILGLVAASPVAILMGSSLAGVSAVQIIISVLTLAGGFVAAYKLGGKLNVF